MGGKKQLSEEAQRFELYPGVQGFPRLGGVVSEGHPGQTPANRLRRGLNVRVQQHGIQIRAGETAVGDFHASDACIRDIYQFDCDPLRMWIATFGCTGGVAISGGTLIHFDPEQEPQLQTYAFYTAATDGDVIVGTYGDEIYVGDGSNLRVVKLAPIMYGVSAQDVEASPPDTLVKSFPGFKITALYEFDGKLFIGLLNVADSTLSKIVSYDTISFTDDKTGIRPITGFFKWRDSLVAGTVAAANVIRLRAAGDAPGTWTTVAPGAGTVSLFGPNAITSFRDNLYLCAGDTKIWKYDGTTLAVVHTVAAAVGTGGISTLDALSHRMVFGYTTADPSAIMGTFDDSGNTIEWIDAVKDFTAQFSNLQILYALKVYRNTLYALFFGSPPENTLISSPGYDLAGTWFGTNPEAASAAARPFEVLVH